MYGRNTIKNGKFCDLWKSALKVSVASREIAESEYIVNNTFTYKVKLATSVRVPAAIGSHSKT